MASRRSSRDRKRTGARRSGARLVLAFALGGCVSGPSPETRIQGEILRTNRQDLSGSFCFTRATSVRPTRGEIYLREVPLDDFRDSSVVHVRHEPDSVLVFRYTSVGGSPRTATIPLPAEQTSWDEGRLRLQLRSQFSGGMGIGSQRRVLSVYRFTDGRLVVEGEVRERGMFLLLIPFVETIRAVVEMPPAGSPACGD